MIKIHHGCQTSLHMSCRLQKPQPPPLLFRVWPRQGHLALLSPSLGPRTYLCQEYGFPGWSGGGVWREKDGCGKEGLEQALTSPSFIKWGFREKSGEGNTLQQYDYLYFSVFYSLRPINPTFPLPERVYSTPSPYPRYEMSARFQRV